MKIVNCRQCRSPKFKGHCFECGGGIPYSTFEAEKVVEEHADELDPYHREMIEWLVWRILCLEREAKK